jgi:L-fuculose-phosphate aldolase
MASESQLRQEIVRIGRLMYEKGFISASDGNISARLSPDRILITPSGLHKGFLEPGDLLIVDEDGQRVGNRTFGGKKLKPTSEMPMHLEVYQQRPDVIAVVHAHPPITIALTIAGIPLADCLLPEVIVFLGLIPTTTYATPSSEENVLAIRSLIVKHDALVLQRHGSLTVGDSPMQAFMRLETVEQNARIAFMLAQLGIHNPMPPDEVRKLLQQREAMGLSRPGEAADFCTVCGVCHTGADHAPTMHSGSHRDWIVARGNLSPTSGPQFLPPIQQPAINQEAIRDIVSHVVHKTLGETSTGD